MSNSQMDLGNNHLFSGQVQQHQIKNAIGAQEHTIQVFAISLYKWRYLEKKSLEYVSDNKIIFNIL